MTFFENIYEYATASVPNIIASITIIILLASFLERLFGVNVIGRRILYGIWIIVKFIVKRLLLPFSPEIARIAPGLFLFKRLATKSVEVETLLTSIVTIKQETGNHINNITEKLDCLVEAGKIRDEKLNNIDTNVSEMSKELKVNGGHSVKDSIIKVEGLLQESVRDRALIRQHLEIEDKLSDRMMFKLDEEGKCSFISNAFLKYFGWRENDLIGDNWIFCIDDTDLITVRAKWDEAFEHKTRYYNKQHIRDVDGTSHNCLVVAYPLMIDGQLVGFRGVVELLDGKGNRIIPVSSVIQDTE